MTSPRIPLTLSALSRALLGLGIFFEAFRMLRLTGGVTIGDALILLSMLLVLAQATQGRARIWLPTWMLLAFPLVLAGTALDAMFVDSTGRTDMVGAVEFAYCAIVLPVIVASQAHDRALAWRLVLAWIAGNVVGAAIGYAQFHRYDLGPLDRLVVWNAGRVAGLTPNPNSLGASLALLTPLCLAFLADTRRPLSMILWSAAILLSIHVIDLTGSRTSIVATGAGCSAVVLLFVARTRQGELPLRFAQLACIGLALFAAWELRSGYQESAIERLLGHSPTARLSTFLRNALMRNSFEAIGSAPFLGHGYGSMIHAAHNVPMALVQGGGIAGFAGFVLTQAGLLVGAVRLFLQSRSDASSRGMAIGMLGLWCTWLALGVFDVSILNRDVYIAFVFPVLWLAARRDGGDATHDAFVPAPGHVA